MPIVITMLPRVSLTINQEMSTSLRDVRDWISDTARPCMTGTCASLLSYGLLAECAIADQEKVEPSQVRKHVEARSSMLRLVSWSTSSGKEVLPPKF